MPPDNPRVQAASRYLLLLVLMLLLLYAGRALFIPLCYGLFVAIVLYPMSRWLEGKGWPRSLAITVGLVLIAVLFFALISLLFLEINALRADFPLLQLKLKPAIEDLRQWINTTFNISVAAQQKWLDGFALRMSDNSGSLLAGTFSATASMLFSMFIVPVFAALFLYNRQDFVLFLEKIAGQNYKARIHDILNKTVHTYAHFIKGMVFVYLIVGVLNSIGLLALGIPHAILFGFMTAVMTIIPYVGIFVSALLPISMALITKDSAWYAVGVIAVFSFVQYLEANLIFPKVVAAELNVSTWATLVAIIAGGIIWGVSGMILFIPFVGLLKMVTDMVPEWEAVNVLLRRNDKP